MAHRHPNVVLRELMREHGLNARKLAEAVNTAQAKLSGVVGETTDRQVRRWLSGESTNPHPKSILAMSEVLQVPGDRLGFILTDTRSRQVASATAPTLCHGDPRDPQEADPVLRRRFVLAAAGNLLTFAFAPLPATGRIGMSDVARISDSLTQLHAVDDAYGGDQLAEVAEKYVDLIETAMSRCLYGPNVEKALYRVLGELHASAGWFAFDSGDHARAGRNLDAGLRGALLSGDRMLQARIWAYMSRQSWELGRGTEAVTVARVALDATRNGRDPRLSALLHGRMAIGYAATGQAARCGGALARAEACLDRASGTPAPWLAFVGPDEILAAAAMAHMDLGQAEKAVEQEEEGMRLLDQRFRRNRFATLVHLSECYLAADCPEQAAHTAGQALDLYESVKCRRWAKRLHAFRHTVITTRLPAAEAFVERYDALTTG